MLTKSALASVEQVVGPKFIVGGIYAGVPICHDLMRPQYHVYNEALEQTMQLNGWFFEFIKVESLPSEEDAKSLEWRAVDLMNNFKYCKHSVEDEVGDLVRAFRSKALNLDKMKELTSKCGNEDAKQVLEMALRSC